VKGDIEDMNENETPAKNLGRDSVIASVKGVLRTHDVHPERLDETIALLCRAVGGMIAVEFDDQQEREQQVRRAVDNIRDGIAYGLEARDG
jgi:hypothetical protein